MGEWSISAFSYEKNEGIRDSFEIGYQTFIDCSGILTPILVVISRHLNKRHRRLLEKVHQATFRLEDR